MFLAVTFAVSVVAVAVVSVPWVTQTLNSIRVVNEDGRGRGTTDEERFTSSQ